MIKTIFIFFGISLSLIITGCTTDSGMSGAGLSGNSINDQYSLADARAARLAVRYEEKFPKNVIDMGTITTRRCHRELSNKPTTQALLDDLLLIAYGQGADGISELFLFPEKTGLLLNCWKLLDAKARLFRDKK